MCVSPTASGGGVSHLRRCRSGSVSFNPGEDIPERQPALRMCSACWHHDMASSLWPAQMASQDAPARESPAVPACCMTCCTQSHRLWCLSIAGIRCAAQLQVAGSWIRQVRAVAGVLASLRHAPDQHKEFPVSQASAQDLPCSVLRYAQVAPPRVCPQRPEEHFTINWVLL